MKITVNKKLLTDFPNLNTIKVAQLVFEEDDRYVVKLIKISPAVSQQDFRNEVIVKIEQRAKEAEWDFAYMKYGDDWKNHVRMGNFWAFEPTKEHFEIVDKVVGVFNGQQ